MEAKKIVVIGSGPGGSGIAALMAQAGHDVTLLEKNSFTGGKCSALEQDGFIVDTGVHMFGRGPGGPFGKIASKLGVELDWCKVDPMLEVFFSGMGRFDMAHSMISPIVLKSGLKVLSRRWVKLEDIFFSAIKTLKNHSIADIFRYIIWAMDRKMIYRHELEDVTVKDFYTSITTSEQVLRCANAQSMITMVVPWDKASMADFLYIHLGTVYSDGFGYPKGGSSRIPDAFLKAFVRDGGKIRTGTAVEKINIENGSVKGVTTASDEFIPADMVISNAGIHRSVELAGRDNFPVEYTKRVDELQLSDAFIATKYYLNRKLKNINAPCMFHVPELDPNEMFSYIETGDIPEDLYLFVTVPSLSDPSLAPDGHELLIVGVPAPHDVSRADQCERLLDKAEEIIENKLFPEVAGAIIKKERTHVVHTSGLTGRGTGECIGLAQLVGQTGSKKPSQKTPIDGLYLVGSDAGGLGIGTECAADSALSLFALLQ